MDPTNLNQTWKSIIAVVALLYNAAIIIFLVLTDKNTHTLAMSWAFGTSIAIMGGLGFGTLTTLVPIFMGKPSTPQA